ncbi:hypothetical protein AAHB46_02110 [Bacillus paranthracis]
MDCVKVNKKIGKKPSSSVTVGKLISMLFVFSLSIIDLRGLIMQDFLLQKIKNPFYEFNNIVFIGDILPK